MPAQSTQCLSPVSGSLADWQSRCAERNDGIRHATPARPLPLHYALSVGVSGGSIIRSLHTISLSGKRRAGRSLKGGLGQTREVAAMASAFSIHPAIDQGIKP